MKNIRLEKPLVFIDLETTGLNPSSDRIVEISLLKVHQDGREDFKSTLINPQMSIPPGASAIHGIKDSDIVDKPTFKECAEEVAEFISNCDVAGFNIKRFDLPLLETEFKRAGVKFSRQSRAIIDSQIIYHQHERRDLQAAYQRYCGKKLEHNHSSEVDVRAVSEILDAQVALYEDLPKNMSGLHAVCCAPEESNWVDSSGKFINLNGQIVFNFGKYKGKPLQVVKQTDCDYLKWILHNADFPLEAQEVVLKALN